MAPSSLLSAVAHQSTGSARLPRPSGSVVDHALPRDSTPPAPLGYSFPSAPPLSSVAQAPPRPSGSPLSPWLISSPSLPQVPPPPALLSSVIPLDLAALPPPWLLPPSAPPWFIVMAVAWVPPGTASSNPLLSLSSPPWLLHQLPGLCLPAPSRVSILLLSLLPSSHPSLLLLLL